MNKAELVFKAIDVLGHAPQNAKSFDGITCIKDIAYGEADLQKGDLYFKNDVNKSGEKKPIVLYIHGGGFIKGDKKHRVTVSEYYANEDEDDIEAGIVGGLIEEPKDPNGDEAS